MIWPHQGAEGEGHIDNDGRIFWLCHHLLWRDRCLWQAHLRLQGRWGGWQNKKMKWQKKEGGRKRWVGKKKMGGKKRWVAKKWGGWQSFLRMCSCKGQTMLLTDEGPFLAQTTNLGSKLKCLSLGIGVMLPTKNHGSPFYYFYPGLGLHQPLPWAPWLPHKEISGIDIKTKRIAMVWCSRWKYWVMTIKQKLLWWYHVSGVQFDVPGVQFDALGVQFDAPDVQIDLLGVQPANHGGWDPDGLWDASKDW